MIKKSWCIYHNARMWPIGLGKIVGRSGESITIRYSEKRNNAITTYDDKYIKTFLTIAEAIKHASPYLEGGVLAAKKEALVRFPSQKEEIDRMFGEIKELWCIYNYKDFRGIGLAVNESDKTSFVSLVENQSHMSVTIDNVCIETFGNIAEAIIKYARMYECPVQKVKEMTAAIFPSQKTEIEKIPDCLQKGEI